MKCHHTLTNMHKKVQSGGKELAANQEQDKVNRQQNKGKRV